MQGTGSHILTSASPRRDGLVASRAFSSPVEGEGPLLRIFNGENITVPPRSRVAG